MLLPSSRRFFPPGQPVARAGEWKFMALPIFSCAPANLYFHFLCGDRAATKLFLVRICLCLLPESCLPVPIPLGRRKVYVAEEWDVLHYWAAEEIQAARRCGRFLSFMFCDVVFSSAFCCAPGRVSASSIYAILYCIWSVFFLLHLI